MNKGQKFVINIIVLLTVGYVGAIIGYNQAQQATSQSQTAKTSSELATRESLLARVNSERAKVGVAPLKEDTRLDMTAQYKASDMVQRGYYSHVDPITGKHGYMYVFDVAEGCTTASENLNRNDDYSSMSTKQAVDSWLGSKTHRDTLLNPEYSLTGFGIDGHVVVEHFCKQ